MLITDSLNILGNLFVNELFFYLFSQVETYVSFYLCPFEGPTCRCRFCLD